MTGNHAEQADPAPTPLSDEASAATDAPDRLQLTDGERDAIFRNCRHYWLGYGSRLRIDTGMTLYSAGVRDPQLNGVMWMGPGDLGARVDEARHCLADLPWLWWVGPDSDPGTLDALLARQGRPVGVSPIMAIRTDRVADLPHPAGLVVEELAPDADLGAWVRTYGPPMGIAAEEIAAMIRAEEARTDPPGSLVRFAARLDGKIVAVSELLVRDGVAGIYLVATDAARRRLGLGAAVTAAAVRLGGRRGARIAALHATPAGQPLYRRLGFTTIADYQIVSLPPL